MNWKLFKVYWKNQYSTLLFYLLGLVLFGENLKAGLERWRLPEVSEQLLNAGIKNYSLEWSYWSASYGSGFFTLLLGIWIFFQVNQPRDNGLVKLLYSKPLGFSSVVKNQLLALIGGGSFLTLFGFWSSNLILIFLTDYQPKLIWFILPPIISGVIEVIFTTTFLYLLSLLLADWRSFLPIHFISWLVFAILSFGSLDYRKLSNFQSPLTDPYLLKNRILLLIVTICLYYLIKNTAKYLERGKSFSFLIQLTKKINRKKSTRFYHASFARYYYAIKTYYGGKIFFAVFSGIVLGLLYASKLKGSVYNVNLIPMLSQAIITLLGLLTTLQLANHEERQNILPTFKRLPKGSSRIFKNKVLAMLTYFLLLTLAFSLPIILVEYRLCWWAYLLALLPPFFFIVGAGYLAILLTKKLFLGYIIGGGLWFFFISIQRMIPFWIQPFYEIAEYRFYRFSPYFLNKVIISGLASFIFLLIFILERRKFANTL